MLSVKHNFFLTDFFVCLRIVSFSYCVFFVISNVMYVMSVIFVISVTFMISVICVVSLISVILCDFRGFHDSCHFREFYDCCDFRDLCDFRDSRVVRASHLFWFL
mgnify:CR=1 FL=1